MNRLTKIALSATLLLGVACADENMKITHLPYPTTERDSSVVEDYFGTKVADPYRWLEDDNSKQTEAWVKAQNEVTFDYLSQIPYRDQIEKRVTELFNYPKESAPAKHGDYYYFYYNDGLQNQSVIYRKASLDGEKELFLDPNALSDDGTKALGPVDFNHDGSLVAYSIKSSGSDWQEIHVRDTKTGKDLKDVTEWVKFSSASWSADGKGYYYAAYDKPKSSVFSSKNENQKLYYHKLGTEQSADELIYTDPTQPRRYYSAFASEDGKWLSVFASGGTNGCEVKSRRIGETKFKDVVIDAVNDYIPVDCRDDKFYFLTNSGALNYRLVAIDLNNPSKVETIIPESDVVLESVSAAGGYLIALYLEDAQNKAYQYKYDGTAMGEIAIPEIGTISPFKGDRDDKTLYYTLTNFITPGDIYAYSPKTMESTLYNSPEVAYDKDMFVTKQLFFTSKDGTRVPLFVTHRKDIVLDGTNPCSMYGYGGFQINIPPFFTPASILFMEQGGVYCSVTLRGGSEYGEEWHQGGMLQNKQNVFDDFISAAEFLIAEKYTSSDKLAIEGGSNGGLLVGACMVQRPDLFAVAFPAVGVLDMLRYHKFTIGIGWAIEYGSSDNEEQFEYIYKYSPLHNIKDGVSYPATLVTTGDHDDRVVPAHSFKFAAQLQKSDSGKNPQLIRIESNAGHGAGKPTSKRIAESADKYAFLFYNTNCNYKEEF